MGHEAVRHDSARVHVYSLGQPAVLLHEQHRELAKVLQQHQHWQLLFILCMYLLAQRSAADASSATHTIAASIPA